MNELIRESFGSKSNNIVELNLTRFGDCCVMAMGADESEKGFYNKHIEYVFSECTKALSNNGKVGVYKNIKCNDKKIKHYIRIIDNMDDLDNFKNNIKNIYSLRA